MSENLSITYLYLNQLLNTGQVSHQAEHLQQTERVYSTCQKILTIVRTSLLNVSENLDLPYLYSIQLLNTDPASLQAEHLHVQQ